MTNTDWIARSKKGLEEDAGMAIGERILEGCKSFDPEEIHSGTDRWVAGAVGGLVCVKSTRVRAKHVRVRAHLPREEDIRAQRPLCHDRRHRPGP